MKYKNFGECLAGIEELMVRQGPFDGLFGFSQVVNYFKSIFVSDINHHIHTTPMN